MWEPSTRYPDPGVRILDPAFARYRLALASVERLYTGCRWSEGPVWFGDGRALLRRLGGGGIGDDRSAGHVCSLRGWVKE